MDLSINFDVLKDYIKYHFFVLMTEALMPL